MKHRHILSMLLIVFIVIPMTGWGQALFDIKSIKFDPSRLFPILSENDIIGAPESSIEIPAITKISDRCLSKMPARFPPSAHQAYCACVAAATQGTMTVGDLRTLQKESNRKLGNKTFEKYVANVMKHCMEIPIEDVEYQFCIMSRDNDWRIRLPIPYCKCTSRGITEHFKKFGLTEMMVSWGTGQNKMGDETPIDTLWNNSDFLKARSMKKEECVGRYMDKRFFK